jgi:hypothetical protein
MTNIAALEDANMMRMPMTTTMATVAAAITNIAAPKEASAMPMPTTTMARPAATITESVISKEARVLTTTTVPQAQTCSRLRSPNRTSGPAAPRMMTTLR